ncbi:MAG: flagellar protein FlaG [Treponema sp.]|nr:flagellar protein FlaG [Treponema sp.]
MTLTSVGQTPVSPAPVYGNVNLQTVSQQDIQPEKKAKPQIIQTATADIQRISNTLNKKLQFVVDHGSNQVIVKVIDKDTDKVIKELPPKELQRLHNYLKDAIGLLFNEMV